MDLPRREVCGDGETALITQVRAVSGASACRSANLSYLCVNFKGFFLVVSVASQYLQCPSPPRALEGSQSRPLCILSRNPI